MKSGKFITIDGPNGVGKTTVVGLVCAALTTTGFPVWGTREPTKSFNRLHEEKRGITLADLIVADRACHLASEVEPALRRGALVVCDRYIESSLVYRKLDGIPYEQTWSANRLFRVPDLSILLVVSGSTLRSRLENKGLLTRFEREHDPEEEALLYQTAHEFLRARGFKTAVVENGEGLLERSAEHILALIRDIA